MKRATGTYVKSTTLGEVVQAFVPDSLPPKNPALELEVYQDLNRKAEMALARLSGVSGLVPSVDWLLYSAIRKEALLTSQIEGTQATLTDLFDEEAGFKVSNTDDVEEVTNSRCWQAAGGTASLTKLDRWHKAGKCGVRAATARKRAPVADRHGAIHS